ncbi:MAG: hypothetical protein JXM74_04675 [Fusobacteriaceae bacterium]|nr:hypothetical protein [Fusobacteriaceae bacterium]MBN2838030.1 hypothetical protein [Fusobacteriaceae bacterium]
MITKEQISFLEVFQIAPVAAQNFYTTLLATGVSPYTTITDTIAYDEVEKVMAEAKILPRGAKFPIGKQEGKIRKATTPDIIKSSIPFGSADGLEDIKGSIVIGGKPVDRKDKKRNERIQKIKLGITQSTEAIATEMFFNQTYSPEQGKPIKFTSATAIAKEYKSTNTERFEDFARVQEQKYQQKNYMYPTHRFIGADIFNQLIANEESKNSPVSITQIGVEMIGNTEVQFLIKNGKKFYVLPSGVDAKGKAISTDGLFILYNNNAIIPGYVGLNNVVGGIASREEADVLIRETTADEETGDAKTLGESGYIPILVNPGMIWKHTITGVAYIK